MSNDEPTAVEARDPQLDKNLRPDTIARLSDGLGSRDPFLVILGGVGTGKTRLVRDVIERWGVHARAALVSARAAGDTAFLESIVRAFGVEPPAQATKSQLRDRLERVITESEGKGRVPVIVIDDAHELSGDLLAELQALANASLLAHRPLEIMLVGRPVLEDRLAAASLESIRNRIALRCQLDALSQQETRRYLNDLAMATSEGQEFFARKACREIFERTNGNPEAVRVLALAAMKRARDTGARTVTADHVVAAASATGKTPAPPKATPPARPTPPAVVAAAQAQSPSPPPRVAAPAVSETAVEHESAKKAVPEPVAQDSESNDPRVREWVSRFIKPDEPRFGELLRGMGPSHEFATFQEEAPGAEESTRDAEAVASAEGALRALRARAARDREGPGGAGTGETRYRRTIAVLSILLAVMTTAVLVLLLRHAPSSPRVEPASTRPVSPPATDSLAVAAPAKPPAPAPVKVTPPDDRFALDVGTYTDRDLAEAERARIVAATNLRGWIVEGSGDESGSYRVILGVYSTRARAVTSAGRLVQTGLATEANVITLPLRRGRR